MTGALGQTGRHLGTALAVWGAASTVAGTALWLSGGRTGRGAFGRQTTAWGAIDLGIAAVGLLRARRRSTATTDEERRRLHRLLVVNSVLDVGYIAGGAVLLARAESIAPRVPGRRPYSSQELCGDGAAIVSQGSFLLILDTYFGLRTRG